MDPELIPKIIILIPITQHIANIWTSYNPPTILTYLALTITLLIAGIINRTKP